MSDNSKSAQDSCTSGSISCQTNPNLDSDDDYPGDLIFPAEEFRFRLNEVAQVLRLPTGPYPSRHSISVEGLLSSLLAPRVRNSCTGLLQGLRAGQH
jgi:hypothetical protein